MAASWSPRRKVRNEIAQELKVSLVRIDTLVVTLT
jgi:hypothetical protein